MQEVDQGDPTTDGPARDDNGGAHSPVHGEEQGAAAGAAGAEAAGAVGGGGDASNESGGGEGYYYLRTYTWTPELGQQEVVLDFCSDIAAGEWSKPNP